MNKNKLIATVAIGLLVIIFIIVIAVNMKHGRKDADQSLNTNQEPQTEQSNLNTADIATTTTSTEDKKITVAPKTGTKVATGAVSNSYTDALKTYGASGYRMQFVNCGATPAQLTIKTGQKFMLDNRDAEAHKIGIGSKTYSVGSYGYVIATASNTVGMVYVTCDGVRTANVLVQP